jgi:hypothetical protein
MKNKVSNNERCEIFMNNVIMEATYEDNPNMQIATNKNPKKLMKNHENKIQKVAWSTKIVKTL